MSKMSDLKLIIAIVCTGIIGMYWQPLHATITNNSKVDPYPVYTSLDPHIFLYMHERLLLKGIPSDRKHREWFGFSISPFGQNATMAVDIDGNTINLGDLDGRWGMIALLYGPTPNNTTFPPLLLQARAALFPDVPLGTPINDPLGIDPLQQWGFFSITGEYKKRGVRGEFKAQILHDFGVNLDVGFADTLFTATNYINILAASQCPPTIPTTACTPAFNGSFNPANPNFTINNINDFLMYPFEEITQQICLDICDFHQTSIEDIRAGLYWRHAYPINDNRARGYSCDWPQFLVIPWVFLEGSAAVSKDLPKNQKWRVPFGNDGHNALGISAGINLDFTETIEIGAEAGFTHFFPRSFSNMPIPTNKFQSGIYPFQTNVTIQPGHNFYIGAKMFAYKFLECLSFSFEYILVSHRNDCITLNCQDPAFMPQILECKSSWTSQMANVAFNYEISPYISIGFLWQPPLAQRNAYQSTTILFSFDVSY